MKRVKSRFGTTLNDVVMALSAAALRRYLLDHGALPDAPLVAMVPASVRSEAHAAGGAREPAPGLDAGQHARARRAGGAHRGAHQGDGPAESALQRGDLERARATRAALSAGARLETYYPVSAVAEGQGLNITVQSYRDHLDFGLIACRELVPDIWRFADLFAEALEELDKHAA